MNILLVEDDQSSRIRLGRFLRELGHQITECDNGCEALELFEKSDFHMLLSDIIMPKMSGIELLRGIKSLPKGPDIDVVLFTGYGDMETAIQALRGGAYDYLQKPISLEELVAITERVSDHQSLRRENRILIEKFTETVEAATEETKRELSLFKKAYAELAEIGQVCISSDSMREVIRQALKLHSDRTIPVLIQGETGTGKEVVARHIHFGDKAITAPFIDINCAALSPGLFESELFGYVAGAYTGGLPRGQRGKLDIARGGTLFFDEITELPTDLQAKLLRVIQEKEFYRVGGLKKIKTDVRIICATNTSIEKRVEEGAFRQDLYYRLNVGRIILPPLRERTEEILPLAIMFLRDFAKKKRKRFKKISDPAARMLLSYHWPGNVRELKNVIELVTLVYDDIKLKTSHLEMLLQIQNNGLTLKGDFPPVVDPANFTLPPRGLDIKGFFDEIVRRALEMHNGNKTWTARYLGISRSSLYCYLERIKFEKPDR